MQTGSLDLRRLLSPSAIAIVGASSNPSAVGGQPLRHLAAFGYRGSIFPVNPGRSEVQGVKCYPDLRALPDRCDVAVIAVSATEVPKVIRQCGEAEIPFAVILSGGFSDASEQGRILRQDLHSALQQSGVRMVGPNCAGVACIVSGAICAFGGVFYDPDLKPGGLGIVSESGGMGMGILAHAAANGIGCHSVISCGEEVDLRAFDFVEALLGTPEVSAVALYMESYCDGRRMRDIGRMALEAGKPILVMKVGNNAAGRRAAASHTGRMTADYSLYQAVFAEGGYIQVEELDEIADVARLVLGGRRPKGRNVAITTASGGWGVMLAEQCERQGLAVPEVSAATAEELRKHVPSFGSVRNPVDITPSYYSDRFEGYNKVFDALLKDPGIDQVIVRSPQGPDAAGWAAAFVEILARSDKPVMCNWAATGQRDAEVRSVLESRGVLCASYATRLARAAGAYTDFCLRVAETEAGQRPVDEAPLGPLPGDGDTIAEHQAKAILEAYGIPGTREMLLPIAGAGVLDALPLTPPLAVKIASPDIPHKTEANGVRLGLNSLAEVREAVKGVIASARAFKPDARLDGVLLQEMVGGVEMIIGAVCHPDFGPYVMVGFGGVMTEIMHDVRIGFAPISHKTAARMLASLKGSALLDGYRGSPPADKQAVCEALVRLSWLITDHQGVISEIEVNPLFVRSAGHGVVAADALVSLAAGRGRA